MKKKDIFVQDSPSSCGACSISSIVSFYGGYVPLEVIKEDTKTDKNGTNALRIVETLTKYGFTSEGIKVDLEHMGDYHLPLIAHVDYDGYEHFLVVYSITDREILTMDPKVGKKVYPYEYFKSIYSGVVLSAIPSRVIPRYAKSKSLLNLLVPIIGKVKSSTLVIIIISLIALCIDIILSFNLRILSSFNRPTLITFSFIILELIIGSTEYIKVSILSKMMKYIDKEAFNRFTTHIFNLPVKVLKNRRVGEIMHKIEDMAFVKDLTVKLTIDVPINILTILFTVFIMSILSLKLTFIYISMMLLYLLVTICTNKIIYREEKNVVDAREEYTGTLVEYLDGIESIKNLNGEERFLNDISNSLSKFADKRSHKDKKYAGIEIVKQTVLGVGSILVNLYGYLSLGPNFTFLDLLTIGGIFTIFQTSSEKIVSLLVDLSKYRAILRNISEFYDLKTDIQKNDYREPFRHLNIEHLSYTYDKITYTIRDFSYDLKLGEKVLIKGPSGIGKSTLVKCISGFDRDYEGNIYINDTSILKMSVASLKDYVVYIGQEETLFQKSIYENVTLGIDDEKLFTKVASMTLLDKVLDGKRDRENTMLLEGASNLSGGERARVILARALYKKPKVLIVDETLSSISEKDEDEIIKNLDSLDDISLIYITHRAKDGLFKNIIEFRKDGNYEITRK